MTGLLREELRFDGVIITDALEMRGVRDYAEIGEAAVLALAAGADALCLGSWSFGADVDTVVAAISGAVEEGRLSLERLEEANDRLARMGSREAVDEMPDPAYGEQLAREVISVGGDAVVTTENVLIVRLDPVASPAAGRAEGDVERFLIEAGRNVETIRLAADTYAGEQMLSGALSEFAEQYGDEGTLVLLLRSPHRFAWQEPIIATIRENHPQAIVLDMGVQHDDFSDFRAWVRSYGSSRSCAKAASEVLLDDDPPSRTTPAHPRRSHRRVDPHRRRHDRRGRAGSGTHR